VPKTGGTSIDRILSKYKPPDVLSGHTSSLEFQMIYPNEWTSYFKFGFVRNPWDRVLSAFFYLRDVHSDRPFVKQCMAPFKDNLDAFIKYDLRKYPRHIFAEAHLRPQAFYLCDTNGKVSVDFVGRFERIKEDWTTVCKQIGIEEPLIHAHRTLNKPNKHYTEFYTTESRSIIAELYREDIRLFGYSFEGLFRK
jgi:hypothetical protein